MAEATSEITDQLLEKLAGNAACRCGVDYYRHCEERVKRTTRQSNKTRSANDRGAER